MKKFFFVLTVIFILGQFVTGQEYGSGNYVATKSFRLNGSTEYVNSVSYFDQLGRLIQTQSKDFATNKIWAQQTLYDYEGRPALTSFSAPILGATSLTGYKADFVLNSDNTTYNILDFDAPANEFNPRIVGTSSNLGRFYSTLNTENIYQDITGYPFSRTLYSDIKDQPMTVIGGNKVNAKWPKPYTFTMPATNELTLNVAFGDVSYGNIETYKTVTRDANGNENVVFTDTDGKVLAAARSGEDGTTSAQMNLFIGEQGYVDIHIPEGITGISTSNDSAVTVYNLIADHRTYIPMGNLAKGFFRVAVKDLENYTPNTIFVRYKVNYYDYSLNEYDEADRLVKSYQPKGATKSAKPFTTYEYNSLGQLVHTKSPDEGDAWFKYRKDGQIRYSQNSKQKYESTYTEEYSYTHYDDLGRPIQSGVAGFIPQPGNPNNLVFENLDPDTNQNLEFQRERVYTQYDYLEQHQLNFLSTLPSDYHNPKFLSGNVSSTRNDESQTYYSYDSYGRVDWLVINNDDIPAKTLDYEYDPFSGNVRQVIYQKGVANEQFYHRYTYNERDQLTKVETSTNGTNYVTHADYEYYDSGELKRTEIANGLQGIDFVYNLAGQLKAINHPSLEAGKDPGGDGNDLFGMQLDYNVDDYQRTSGTNVLSPNYGTDQLNGNIKGIRWNNDRTVQPDLEKLYSYSYNRNNWLTDADYAGFGTSGTTATPTVDDTNIYNSGVTQTQLASQRIRLLPGFHAKYGSVYTARIVINDGVNNPNDAYDVENVTYDANGNILTLQRNKGTDNAGTAMDNLTYSYPGTAQNGPNRLGHVDDAAGNVSGADDIGDQSAGNYHYNGIGQLTLNTAENVAYSYNVNGLVTEIKKDGQTLLKLYYNDRNHRVRKEVYAGGSMSSTTYYVRDLSGTVMAIYQKMGTGSVALKEQPIYGNSRLGINFRSGSNSSYMYELTDHLGNVRVIFNGTTESYADYYPYGMPMPGPDNSLNANEYRYAYQGQEKDPNTGKEAFELRIWDSRIGRWLSPDPYKQYSSPYLGMGNNPINGIDPDGGCFNEDGSDCDLNAAIGTTTTGAAGYEWTMTENGWARSDGYGVTVSAFQGDAGKGGYLLYVAEAGGSTHSFLADPKTLDFWEASHPFNDKGGTRHGAVSRYLYGNEKSIIRQRNLTDEDFWEFNAGGKERGDLSFHLVYVPNKELALEYANSHVGTYDYHFTGENCKNFAIDALNAGHANIPNQNPIPAFFTDSSGELSNGFFLANPDRDN
ncbi:hypothetical protein FGF1_14910 [Flavobacteriaceae bacterium GF1]